MTSDERSTDTELHRELQQERARAARAEREIRRLRARVDELEDTLEAVYQGETFRLGELLLKVPRRLKLWWRSRRRGATGRSSGGATTVTVRDEEPTRGDPPRGPRLEPDVTRDRAGRDRYERLISRDRHVDAAGTRVAFAVSTTDLDAARGDLYTAAGLALALEAHGASCVLLDPERWYDPPDGTDVIVAMVCEPELRFAPHRCPPGPRVVAWVRNSTDRWRATPGTALYDGLLASSERTAEVLAAFYDGPIEVLPIAVDRELFERPDDTPRRGALATLNQWTHERPRRVYEQLAASGVDVPLVIRGVTRGLPPALADYAGGPVDFFALPSLYAQVAVVLDDQQDVNRRFGNVNSRIFEALAAGALPVTGAPRGLPPLGLEDLPVFDDASSLRERVEQWTGDDEARTRLVQRLREHVLTHHTYDDRAATFAAFVERLEPRRVRVVGYLPDYTITNPFQRLLYDRVPASAVPVRSPGDIASLARRGLDAVLHVHWTAPVLGPATDVRDAERRCDAYLAEVDEARDAGASVIWTVHNVLPHECRHPAVEQHLRQGLADRADVIHVMCPETVDAVSAHYELDPARTHVIAHGSYVDVYPNIVDEEDARRELGLPADARVLLFLGQIRPYKGVADLLDAFDALAARRSDVRLVVAGDVVNHPGTDELRTRLSRTARVTAELGEVPDERLQVFLNACDVVVLPHRSVLNSGGALLAYSFARPIVAPRTGCLTELVTEDTGVLFDEVVPLDQALGRALELDRETSRRAAIELARTHTFVDASQGLAHVLRDVWGSAGHDGGADTLR